MRKKTYDASGWTRRRSSKSNSPVTYVTYVTGVTYATCVTCVTGVYVTELLEVELAEVTVR